MNRVNKWVYCIELILFAMPVYMLAISFGFLSFGGAIVGNTLGNPIVEAVTLIFIFLSLWVFAKISYEFIFRFDRSLILGRPWHWICIYAILVYTLAGALISMWLQSLNWSAGHEPSSKELLVYSSLFSCFKWALFGTPMLVPGFHLVAMKLKYMPKNNF